MEQLTDMNNGINLEEIVKNKTPLTSKESFNSQPKIIKRRILADIKNNNDSPDNRTLNFFCCNLPKKSVPSSKSNHATFDDLNSEDENEITCLRFPSWSKKWQKQARLQSYTDNDLFETLFVCTIDPDPYLLYPGKIGKRIANARSNISIFND